MSSTDISACSPHDSGNVTCGQDSLRVADELGGPQRVEDILLAGGQDTLEIGFGRHAGRCEAARSTMEVMSTCGTMKPWSSARGATRQVISERV